MGNDVYDVNDRGLDLEGLDPHLRRSPEERAVIYDGVEYRSFSSSNVAAFWYDYDQLELYVEFDPKDEQGNSRGEKSLYTYQGVPEQVVVNFMRADSKGKYVWKALRGRYGYHRIY